VRELVRYVGCLPLAIGLASAHAHGTASPAEFLAALKRVAPPPHEQPGSKSGPKSSSLGLWTLEY